MTPPWRTKSSRMPHPVFFGLALITVGLLWLLREMGVLPDIRFWTLLWLGIGGWLFVGTVAGRRRGWFWPLTLLGIGTLMLLQDLDTIRTFSLVPVIIIGLGAAMVIEAVDFRNRRDGSPDTTAEWRDL
ncbi:MAG: hypothetical protein KQH83_06170 [Actinobacteria bacterium]|nr:hypothetical protein [Actinomycetota bacterium]